MNITNQILLADDVDVVVRVGGGRNEGEEITEILGTADFVELSGLSPTRVGRFSSRPNRRANAHGMGEPKLTNQNPATSPIVCLLAGYCATDRRTRVVRTSGPYDRRQFG